MVYADLRPRRKVVELRAQFYASTAAGEAFTTVNGLSSCAGREMSGEEKSVLLFARDMSVPVYPGPMRLSAQATATKP